MGMIEGGIICRGDDDCSELQYCYDVSKQCVDYTRCSRYNRQEGVKHAREPAHCGPCLPGYSSEKLGTGEMALLCKKNNVEENVTEPNELNSVDKIWITAGVLFTVLVLMVLFGIIFKRRRKGSSSSRPDNRKEWAELCVVGPSAPPAENSPFIGFGKPTADSSYNNNHNLKDKNKLLKAAPFKDPYWIRSNPNYEFNLSDVNLNEATDSTGQIQPADTNSNSWTPQELTMQIVNGNLTEYDVEQIDNTMNAVLVRRNEASTSNEAENHNNNNNTSNSNGSTSESNDTQSNRERMRASNILITQKISMNVNVHNSDF